MIREPEQEVVLADHLYCIASERAFVGCVVHGEGAPLDICPATEEHFFDATARRVFTLARELYAKGAPVNSRTVMRSFISEPQERIQHISEVCFYPAPSQASHFFAILNDKLTIRRAQQTIAWAQAAIASNPTASTFCAELSRKVAALDSTATSDDILHKTCDAITEKLARMARGEIVRGIETRLSPWDNSFGGLLPGQLYALAGRPGTGKTSAFEMMIQECLELEIPVSVFEKDMSPQKLIERMACRAANVQFWRMARGSMHDYEIRNLQKMVAVYRESPLHLYNPAGLTADRLCQIARKDIRTKGVKAVFLDHIQALNVGKELRVGLTQASLAIRANVTDTEVPHVILAHINRNGGKGRPTPEDIKEFDQLYGDCDGMMILWSEQSRAEMASDEMMTTKFYTAKNRDGGVTENEMLFDGAKMTFKEKAKER